MPTDARRHYELLRKLEIVERGLIQRIEDVDRRLSAHIIKSAKKESREKKL